MFKLLENHDINYLNDILMKDGKLQVLNASVYENIPEEHIQIFCVRNGLYQLPTTELLTWVTTKINGRKAIEIGAGNGAFAEALGIPATDSFMQEIPEVVALYQEMRQQPVKYGKNVFKFDAKRAIKKWKPKVVIANWVTQIYRPDSDQGNILGVNENWLLKKVETYIHIGNRNTHKKRILDLHHDEYQFPWLISRSLKPEDNIIYVWNKDN